MNEDDLGRAGGRMPVEIAHEVAELLDAVVVRGPSHSGQMAKLRELKAEWAAAGGGEEGTALFPFTEGALGMLRASTPGDSVQLTTYADLTRAKQQWRPLARGE